MQDLLRRDPALGTLADLYHRIQAVIDDPTSSLDTMARIIGADPALSARLLRIANSGLYQFPSRVDSIAHAIGIIGTQQVRDLVLAATLIQHFQRIPVSGVDMASFWRHSIGCALLARSVAFFRREANVERAYVAGLLHDIGRLILFMHLEDLTTRVLEARDRSGDLLYRVESRELGFDHTQLGAALLERWRLPPVLTEPVRHHHTPDEARRYPMETAMVHLADSMAHALRLGTSGERFVPPVDETAWHRLALPESALEQIAVQTDRHYQQALEVFLT
ncbi:MAG: HDOD domain-containing protein [Ectothiorhodospira sp.]